MQYQIPQFIEVEDQIFGSLTLKQFIYVVGGGGMAYASLHFLNIFIGLPIAILIGIFAGMLAFYKLNKRPFIDTVESALKYFFSGKLYIWKKDWKKDTQKDEVELKMHSKESQIKIPSISQNKLKDLSWSLDINEKLK